MYSTVCALWGSTLSPYLSPQGTTPAIPQHMWLLGYLQEKRNLHQESNQIMDFDKCLGHLSDIINLWPIGHTVYQGG
jgi:hypothetical protein